MGDLVGPGGSEKITAAHIRRGLRKFFPDGRCGIVFECAQGTGARAHRHLDALAMDLWPSHGLLLHGIEIKVDLYDWRRELADPSKAEQLARFCDKFWVAAPPGVIPVAELPHAWGLLEGGENGMRITKAAEKTPAEKVTRDLLAAVFRASSRSFDADETAIALESERKRLRDQHAEDVKRQAERLSTNNSEDAKNWRRFMEALGFAKADDPFSTIYGSDATRWIGIAKAIHKSGIMESWHGLASLHATMKELTDRVGAAVKTLHVPTDHITPSRKGKRK